MQKERKKSRAKYACLSEAAAQAGFHAHAIAPPRIWLGPARMGYLT